MYTVLTILHVVVCSFLILVVLLQAGKGGGMGIAFGGGGSQTVFGSSGAGNFLTRLTAICAATFFILSLVLAYLSSQSDSKRLQGLAQRKAAEKQTQQAATDKVAKEVKDLDQARKAIETSTGMKVEISKPGEAKPAPGAPMLQVTEVPASGDKAPATDKAPGAEKTPATTDKAAGTTEKSPPAEPGPARPRRSKKAAPPAEDSAPGAEAAPKPASEPPAAPATPAPATPPAGPQ